MNILFSSISELVTNSGVRKKDGRKTTYKDLGIQKNAALIWNKKEGVKWFGSHSKIPREFRKIKNKEISLFGKTLSPTLVDCHTHLVFAGNRHHEFALRLSGLSYQDIAKQGGGMINSIRDTRLATEEELLLIANKRVQTMNRFGVGIVEIKSGYGLSFESEIKVLNVAQKIKKKNLNSVFQITFLGAHAFPPEARSEKQKEAYVSYLIRKALPFIAEAKLADACDVFFDEGYFSESQTRRIQNAARSFGLKVKLHADELADTGGSKLAVELKALSADHLLKINSKNIQLLSRSNTVGVLLPTTAFYLGLEYAPARKLIDSGACVAVATDFNPGSSPCLNLPFAMTLACVEMKMTPSEVWAAATFGGAKALGLESKHGFIEVGSKAKLSVFNTPSFEGVLGELAHPGLCDSIF